MTLTRRALYALAAVALAGSSVMFLGVAPAVAAIEPSFEVPCYPSGTAAQQMHMDDPIVFPGQPGKSHMHTFFGAKGTDAYTTLSSLLASGDSQCGKNYDAVDQSAYWVPTLYRDGVPEVRSDGSVELRVYYKRAGGASGVPIDQAFPRGLRMIAGNAMATSNPDPAHIWFKCAMTNDPGRQSGYYTNSFPDCDADQSVVLTLTFPDCWDGKHLDSADHKSHMAYSGGTNAACPSSHPVKLPQIIFEAWYYGVNGPPSDFQLKSPDPADRDNAFTFHGDVISAWDTKAAASLVNYCLNEDTVDCNTLTFDRIPIHYTPAQLDAQTAIGATTAPSPDAAGSQSASAHGGSAHSATTHTAKARSSHVVGASSMSGSHAAPATNTHGAGTHSTSGAGAGTGSAVASSHAHEAAGSTPALPAHTPEVGQAAELTPTGSSSGRWWGLIVGGVAIVLLPLAIATDRLRRGPGRPPGSSES